MRQLDTRAFGACFDAGVHLTLSVGADGFVALAGTVATPWGDQILPLPESSKPLTAFLTRWARGSGRSMADYDYVRSTLPKQPSDPVFFSTNDPRLKDGGMGTAPTTLQLMLMLQSVLSPSLEYASLLFVAAGVHFPAAHDAEVPAVLGDCFFCRMPVSGLSRDARMRAAAAAVSIEAADTYEAAASSDEEEDHEAEVAAASDEPVCDTDATTGRRVWCHRSCADSVRKISAARVTVYIDVAEQSTMNALLEAVAQRPFLNTVCDGGVPTIMRNGRDVRNFQISIPLQPAAVSAMKRGRLTRVAPLRLAVKFRGPKSFGADDVWRPEISDACERVVQYGAALRSWARRERAATGLCPLLFETAVSYSRAALLHSVTGPPPTSICSSDGLQFVNRITKGGRLFTGCAVMHPPLAAPETDRSIVRLTLDFTAKYPDVVKRWPLPHQEHTLSLLHDFSRDLGAGILFVSTYNSADPALPVCCVEVSGSIPSHKHLQYAQFPPLFSRLHVPVGTYTPFQRVRLHMALTDAPTERSVPHLLPLEREVLCLREATLLHRLGFAFTHIGQVWGCKGSFWARPFMAAAETRRRKAAVAGDTDEVAAVKLLTNSVLGSLNMNLQRRLDLRAVLTTDLSFKSSLATGQEPVPEGDPRSGRRSVRLADDPRFTGRIFTAGDLTLVEMTPKPEIHSQMTFFALLVQAYARCDHVEFMYGSSDGKPGLLHVFPATRVLYANTDSVTVELSADSETEGTADARVLLWRRMQPWLDLSNVPVTSSLWKAMPPEERDDAVKKTQERAGEWGLVKEETGYAGIDAFVVNGPNRYAYRVVQSLTDTPPAYRKRTDVLKSLPAAWTHAGTTVEQYIADWRGGHTPAEIAALEAAALPGVPIPTHGTSLWGNAAAIVSRTGQQWPLGMCPEVDAELAAALADTSL